MLKDLSTRIARKGFVGPRYRGLMGKARFALESTVARQELFFVNTLESFRAVEVPEDVGLTLHRIREFADFAPFTAGVEAEYYPGYVEAWRAPFTWGEQAVIGTVDGRVASYNWMQYGMPAGFPTYWGRMFAGEARFIRGGVVPSFRRGGLNTLMKYRLLERFFGEEGITRVYAECYKNNLPSVRTLLRLGFRAVALLTVLEMPPLRGFIRWSSIDRVKAEFLEQGVDLAAAPSASTMAEVRP